MEQRRFYLRVLYMLLLLLFISPHFLFQIDARHIKKHSSNTATTKPRLLSVLELDSDISYDNVMDPATDSSATNSPFCANPTVTPVPPSGTPTPETPTVTPVPPSGTPTPETPTVTPVPPSVTPTPETPTVTPVPPSVTPTPETPTVTPVPPSVTPTPVTPTPASPTTQPLLTPPNVTPSPPKSTTNPPIVVPAPPIFTPGPPIFLPPVVYPPPLGPPPPMAKQVLWCVAKPSVPDPIIQEAMDYACGSGGDCSPIKSSGPCYQPNTVIAHASYAFNSYWQNLKETGATCDFGGAAVLVTKDPSYDNCHFKLASA